MANIYTCFVDTTYIKENSPIIAYVSDDELRPFIRVAMDIHIQRVLGTNLFKDLQNKVLTNTLDANEIILLNEYIQQATMYWTITEYLLYSHYKFTNKGINKQNSDNSTSAELNEVNFVRDDIRNKSEYFSERLMRYLIAYPDLFPLYYGGQINPSTIIPKTNNYFSGVYTGRKGYGYCNDCPNEVHNWTFIDVSNKFR